MTYTVTDNDELITKPSQVPEVVEKKEGIYPDVLERFIVYKSSKKKFLIMDVYNDNKVIDDYDNFPEAAAACQVHNQQELLDELGKAMEAAQEDVIEDFDRLNTVGTTYIKNKLVNMLKDFQLHVLTSLQGYAVDNKVN
jgi:hypothetical protein